MGRGRSSQTVSNAERRTLLSEMGGVLRSRRVVRSRHRLASDGLNHVLILTMSVAVTVEANYAHEW